MTEFEIRVIIHDDGEVVVQADPPGIMPLDADGFSIRDALEGLVDSLETIAYPGT